MPIGTTPLDGKRVLVTGGTTGIGRATVLLLAAEGARVATFGRHAGELQDALDAAVDGVIGLTADAADPEGITAVFGALDEQWGGIDILVANAALGADPVDQMADGDWRNVVETNLVGYMACAREAIMRMDQQGGHLVFIGSVSSHIKAVGESVYAATKAGVDAFAETLRKEVAERGIKVSVIQPGLVGTDMTEVGPAEQREAIERHAMLMAEDVADAVRYVLTRAARTDVLTLRIEPRIQANA